MATPYDVLENVWQHRKRETDFIVLSPVFYVLIFDCFVSGICKTIVFSVP